MKRSNTIMGAVTVQVSILRTGVQEPDLRGGGQLQGQERLDSEQPPVAEGPRWQRRRRWQPHGNGRVWVGSGRTAVPLTDVAVGGPEGGVYNLTQREC